MPDTSTPAQDLDAGDDPFGALPYPQLFAAIDTVEAMARRTPFNAGDSVTEDFHTCLSLLRRKVVKVQQSMEWASVRGACGTSPHASFLAGWEAALRSASVGAQIVWPSPDSAEVADSPAGDDTAPGIDTAASAIRYCRKSAACYWRDGHDGDCGFMTNTSTPEPTAREKILAEVAAVDLPVPAEAALRGIVNTACEIARGALPGVGRDEIVRAAAMLVLAVERLDGAR